MILRICRVLFDARSGKSCTASTWSVSRSSKYSLKLNTVAHTDIRRCWLSWLTVAHSPPKNLPND